MNVLEVWMAWAYSPILPPEAIAAARVLLMAGSGLTLKSVLCTWKRMGLIERWLLAVGVPPVALIALSNIVRASFYPDLAARGANSPANVAAVSGFALCLLAVWHHLERRRYEIRREKA